MRARPRIAPSLWLTLLCAFCGLAGPRPAAAQDPRLDTQVLGQDSWLVHSSASLRVIAKDHTANAPVPGAQVEIALTPALDASGKPKGSLGAPGHLFTGQTGADGTVQASFAVPDFDPGNYGVQVTVHALGETDLVNRPLSLRRTANVLITTDKPLYQPGQVIHIRALALQEPSLVPLGSAPITLEVSDGKGNKVFKNIGQTSAFGVSSADFQLADEINLGSYRVRAETAAGAVERTVTVQKYVLPKFKVTATTDRKFYAPGAMLAGDVQSDYFFGKPVHGKAHVVLSTFDVGFNDFATIDGTLDDSGHFQFHAPLPTFFAGDSLHQGNAFVKIDTTVTDTAGQAEEIVTTAPVAQDGLRITAIPESGSIVPNVPNTVYLVATYPDGTPAAAQIVVNADGVNVPVSTDASGLGSAVITPKSASLTLTITASDSNGNRGTWKGQFYSRYGDDSLLLHVDRALYRVGDTAHLVVFSPATAGTIYFDVIRNGQTIRTEAADVSAGRATLDLPLDGSMAGTLAVNAYRINQYGQMVRDTRVLFVDPAADLKIAVSGNGSTYLPGSDAKLSFHVTDAKGTGVAAALGINIVDESVFALQEMQPGLEKVYFLLEQEILDPKYEIHGIDPGTVITSPPPGPIPVMNDNQRQVAAAALFANLPPAADFTLTADTYTDKLQQLQDSWTILVIQDARKVADGLQAFHFRHPKQYPTRVQGIGALVDDGELAAYPVDHWGHRYHFDPFGNDYSTGFSIHSLGPDGKDNSGDEIYAFWQPGSQIQSNGRTLILPGDANGDGTVDVKDAILILRVAVGITKPDAVYAANYDANGDGKVDLSDAVLALQAAVGGPAPAARLSPYQGGLGDGGGIKRGGGPFGGGFPPGGFPVPGVADGAAGGPVATTGTTSGGTSGTTTGDNKSASPGATPDVRVRQFFPETLYSNPAVITDDGGNADLDVPIADSITTWRISALASSMQGSLGSTDAPLRVFQDFFVDIDFPVSLTQGDEVSVPVAVYNYLGTAQTVTLTADPGTGFDLLDPPTQTVTLNANEVKAASFRVRAKGLGFQSFLVHAAGPTRADAVKRSVEIVPNGARIEATASGRLTGTVDQTVHLPADGIDGSFGLLVKVYPGLYSQLVEGLDSIFQMPFGCFEQTTSTTYPNVLALQYLKRTGKADPAVQLKAEGYINLGYQRLVTFEVPGGGFEWFGHAPANQVLTAYGLLEFSDMAKVYSVDPALIQRTGQWLAGKQAPDGTWTPDQAYLNDGIWNRISDKPLPVTAYAVWALAESGYQGDAVTRGVAALKGLWPATDQVYLLGLVANALVSAQSDEANAVLQRLLDLRKTTDDGLVYWQSDEPTLSYSRGGSADVETTAYITYALVRSGLYGDVASKALGWLVKQKAPNGTWGNTQATVMALKALIASQDAATQSGTSHVDVFVNGQAAGGHDITADNADVLWQLDARPFVKAGDNDVKLVLTGQGQSMYQISGWGYEPWPLVPVDGPPSGSGGTGGPVLNPAPGKLDLSVTYDRTQLPVNGEIVATAHVAWEGPGAAEMVIVDLGIPPGFDVNADDFGKLIDAKTIEKYSLTGRQVIVYLQRVTAGQPLDWTYRLKAKYPLTAQTPESKAYTYYNPEVQHTVPPQQITVTAGP